MNILPLDGETESYIGPLQNRKIISNILYPSLIFWDRVHNMDFSFLDMGVLSDQQVPSKGSA